MYTCEFCNKQYSSISNINHHKKTARFCIDIQEKLNSNINSQCVVCEFCKKKYSTKYNYEQHKHVCKHKITHDNYNNLIKEKEELEQKLLDAQEQIKKLSENPHTINNSISNSNNTNNYNINFNLQFEKLPEFMIENVKESLLASINVNSIKGGEEKYINDFVDGIKKFIIVKDLARNKVVTKEKGKQCKTTSNKVIEKSFKFIKEEQDLLLDKVREEIPTFTGSNIKENCKINIMVNKIRDINTDIEKDKSNSFMNTIANKLTKEGIMIE
jgi:hypothetical protein